ncbi:hypothetical protein PP707_02290 [Acetobacter pasteurianus]|nr:hypothetical protein [Acetobacter pasteurianus]
MRSFEGKEEKRKIESEEVGKAGGRGRKEKSRKFYKISIEKECSRGCKTWLLFL